MIDPNKPPSLEYESPKRVVRPTAGDYVVLTVFCFFMVSPVLFFLITMLVTMFLQVGKIADAFSAPVLVSAAIISLAIGAILFRHLTRVRRPDV